MEFGTCLTRGQYVWESRRKNQTDTRCGHLSLLKAKPPTLEKEPTAPAEPSRSRGSSLNNLNRGTAQLGQVRQFHRGPSGPQC